MQVQGAKLGEGAGVAPEAGDRAGHPGEGVGGREASHARVEGAVHTCILGQGVPPNVRWCSCAMRLPICPWCCACCAPDTARGAWHCAALHCTAGTAGTCCHPFAAPSAQSVGAVWLAGWPGCLGWTGSCRRVGSAAIGGGGCTSRHARAVQYAELLLPSRPCAGEQGDCAAGPSNSQCHDAVVRARYVWPPGAAWIACQGASGWSGRVLGGPPLASASRAAVLRAVSRQQWHIKAQ